VVDGCPAGLFIDEDYIQGFLDRRKPGNGAFATKRKEGDRVEILSGVFEGRTTGCPIMLAVKNEDARSGDYGDIKDVLRPSHADFGFVKKYGFRDYRGGGRASGRETICRVAAGAIAVKALSELGISFLTFTKNIGSVETDENNFDENFIGKNELYMPDEVAYEKAVAYLNDVVQKGDSAGGVIECRIMGVKPGIGQPVFDKLDAAIARAVFSIGAVKAVEFGAGFGAALMNGSTHNDPFCSVDGKTVKKSNNAGGVTGGLSDGATIVFRAAIKPTPSISKRQETVDINGNNTTVSISGRHDPVIVPRAVVVVETMAAIVLFDMILAALPSRMENVLRAYENL
jgi:chorismate synthase